MTITAYRPRPTRRRRSRAEMVAIREAIYDVAARDRPVTCRQVFYRLVSLGVVAKRESEYKATVIRLLGKMRRSGEIPFGWIADNTRWMRKPRTFSSVEMALRRTAEGYRRALWDSQDSYVEVWLEKDALAGVIYEVTEEWDVPLMVTRGYPSLSFLYEAAEAIDGLGKPVYLYYFGDWDPSGVDIDRTIEQGIAEFAQYADIRFERMAVTPNQIAAYNLLARPTKPTDSRSASFSGESVEVDAIPPDMLREIVAECITKHVDRQALRVLQLAEQSERELLERMVAEATNGR